MIDEQKRSALLNIAVIKIFIATYTKGGTKGADNTRVNRVGRKQSCDDRAHT